MIPHILTPNTLRSSDNQPTARIQNKCLITWGFTSTSFSAEPIRTDAKWVVAIERNQGQLGNLNTGYLFGLGIASKELSGKDQIGMNEKSHGIICLGGAIFFAHNGQQDLLTSMEGLPLLVTVSVDTSHPDHTIFSYVLSPSSGDSSGVSLRGRRVITETALKDCLLPVFTVSQRVKLLFPTCV